MKTQYSNAVTAFRFALPAIVCLFCILTFCSFNDGVDKVKEIVVIDSTAIPRSEKEALLIIPGFGSRIQGITDIGKYFAHKGYDLFIPHYIGRDSIGQCMNTLDEFMKKNKLSEYRKVHVFSYIIGSWVLNRWITAHPTNNIATIVYDRSPLQERAPYALVHDMPFLIRLAEGRIMEEFTKTPYEPIANDQKNIGIIMESRATNLIKKHKAAALSLGTVDWTIEGRKQDHDDYFFTLNNHDDMYHDFSVIGTQILYFIRNGKFTPDAPREKPNIDPFAD